MSQPNWGLLVTQGRAKAIGIPWTDLELKAVYELKIPVDFVRAGCLNLEQYAAEKKKVEAHTRNTGEKPLRYMSKPELVEKAQSVGILIPTDDVTKNEIVHLIEDKLNEPSQTIEEVQTSTEPILPAAAEGSLGES